MLHDNFRMLDGVSESLISVPFSSSHFKETIQTKYATSIRGYDIFPLTYREVTRWQGACICILASRRPGAQQKQAS
jgi:hypothetical protein